MVRNWLIGVGFVLCSATADAQTYFTDIGYTALQDRLGAATPTGAGVSLVQVEAPSSGNYRPNTSLSQFSGITFTDHSTGGSTSTHATDVGKYLYGRTNSMAVGVTQVHLYNANTWLGSEYLNTGTVNAPLVSPGRIQNLSFVGTAANATSSEALQRLDYAAFTEDTIFVAAVNNGSGTTVPPLFGSSYNAITVGLTNGGSSKGTTVFETSGRSKPDLVAPGPNSSNFTSFSTPLVASATALLVETASLKSDVGEAERAGKLVTIKAALLSGATTDEFASLAEPWTRKTNTSLGFVEPLDRRFGAGELNINNSHLILSAAEQSGSDSTLDATTGWDFETLSTVSETRRYYLDIPTGQDGTLTATVNWLRPISGITSTPPTIPTVELRIYEVDSDFNNVTLIDSSVSTVDNVQHTLTNLTEGHRYAIDVRLASLADQSSVSYGAAWRTEFTPVPEPLTVMAFGAVGLVGCRWRFGR